MRRKIEPEEERNQTAERSNSRAEHRQLALRPDSLRRTSIDSWDYKSQLIKMFLLFGANSERYTHP